MRIEYDIICKYVPETNWYSVEAPEFGITEVEDTLGEAENIINSLIKFEMCSVCDSVKIRESLAKAEYIGVPIKKEEE